MYKSCGKNGVIQDKIGKKGVILSRRDSAVLVRTLYERTIEMIFENIPPEDILYFIIQELNKICSKSFSNKDYVITKAVGDVNEMTVEPFIDEKGIKKARIGNYTVPILPTTKSERDKQLLLKDAEDENEYYKKCLPAVVQLAEKMRSRGQRVDAGTRLEYVIIDNGIKNDKQYNKLENLEYFESHSDILKLDYMYYVKLLVNPVDQLLNVAFDNEKNNKKYKYKYQKDFLLNQYDFRVKTRDKVLDEIKSLFKPKIEFQKK
jgi:DNA polymerase elongation subunit (family B)